MRPGLQTHRGLLIAVSSLVALALLGAKIQAQQKPSLARDQQVTVSRGDLREIADALLLIRDSINGELKQLENEYLHARQNGARAGDPEEKAIRAELERQSNNFNRLVDQIQRLQRLADGK